jgi:8-oxo-dGTP pyrophosphatase MutT (NUDIX family)
MIRKQATRGRHHAPRFRRCEKTWRTGQETEDRRSLWLSHYLRCRPIRGTTALYFPTTRLRNDRLAGWVPVDISWTAPAGSFKYRSAAVLRHGDRLLLCAVDHIDGWFLPGGRVQFGENSATALARELHEELDLEVTVTGEPILIVEGIRAEDGVLHQEVCCYYEVPWPDGIPPETVGSLPDHRFRWVRPADLPDLHFLPPEIVTHLTDRHTTTRHLTFDRRRRSS